MSAPIVIGNGSGFYGDRFSAMREMLEGGALHVLTGDYLAELTMLILGRDRLKDPTAGYAKTFLRQMETCLGLALERNVKVVVNAGGLNPSGLRAALQALADKLGLHPKIAHVDGDDLAARAGELGLGAPLTANAYLGGWGIAACLQAGADVVVTGRVTDASLVVGPAAAHFGWARTDWDRLAAAVVAGHVIECGPQATGGNFSFFKELDTTRSLGFPWAEVHEDGTVVIGKHPGTGGAVTVETVTSQLLYEVGGARYAGPDVTARLDSIALRSEGPDRVRISGVRGEPPPPTTKVCLNHLGGYRNDVELVLVGLDIEEKAALARRQIEAALVRRPSELSFTLARTARPDADVEEEAAAILRVSAKDGDGKIVGRAFSAVAVELALSSYPGFNLTAPPGDASPYGVYTPAYVASELIAHQATLPDGTKVSIACAPQTLALGEVDAPAHPATYAAGPTERAPLGTIMGARSGDKGGVANLGVWARDDAGWAWLSAFLTTLRLQALLPETARFPVARHLFPSFRGMNFVIDGLLGQGVSSSTRFDPQAKALGEWLRARVVELPTALLAAARA